MGYQAELNERVYMHRVEIKLEVVSFYHENGPSLYQTAKMFVMNTKTNTIVCFSTGSIVLLNYTE